MKSQDTLTIELKNALIATWIIIESDPEFDEYASQCKNSKTGKTLRETVEDLIKKTEKNSP